MGRLFGWLNNIINPHDEEPEAAPEKKTAVPANSRRPVFPECSRPSGDGNIDDADYWWCFEGHPHEDIPLFDIINNDLIIKDIKNNIKTGALPVMEIPDNVIKTLRLLDDPEFSYREVANLIERSPGMAGEFLKITNSSLVSTGTTIHDLKTALPRLGKVKIKSMLYMYSSKASFMHKSVFESLAVDIVEHSYAVGLIAGFLSQRYFANPDVAFFAGLLHDIGKLAILKSIAESYDIPKRSGMMFCEEMFDRIFPELHEKVGLYIAQSWRIEDSVKAAIMHHHDLYISPNDYANTEMVENLCCLINISDTIAKILGKGKSIGAVNIFQEESVNRMHWVKDWSTVEFLGCIPEMMDFKLER